jgi:hypothetical protein
MLVQVLSKACEVLGYDVYEYCYQRFVGNCWLSSGQNLKPRLQRCGTDKVKVKVKVTLRLTVSQSDGTDKRGKEDATGTQSEPIGARTAEYAILALKESLRTLVRPSIALAGRYCPNTASSQLASRRGKLPVSFGYQG